MFKINKLSAEILSDKSKDINDLYGFEFSFDKGLNIIAGPNSRGKTTINTCIYYCLGMEELLGAHNDKALDKALKEEFTIHSNDTDEDSIDHKVLTSKIFLEIENEKKEIVYLERYVKANNDEIKTSNITVSYSKLSSKGNRETNKILIKELYYVNARGNNDNPNGFYNWLSSFIGIKLPQVSNSSRVDNYSPLYLQTIFSALFIEQTKGWSDFFATMPFLGIVKNKEKIVEFLLALNEIHLSTEKDILTKERTIILEDWQSKLKSFSYLEKQFNSNLINIPETLTTDKSEIDKISVMFTLAEGEKISLESFQSDKLKQVEQLENKPISLVSENKEVLIEEYNKQKHEYSNLKDYIEKFENKLLIERRQIILLTSQLKIVESEIKDHLNLQKVFNENIINEKASNHCPTCSQEVTTNLISSKNIKIPQLTLEENTSFLKSQKKIIESSSKNLKDALTEKENLLIYFRNSLRKKESLLKSISKDLISDDRAFSEADVVKKIQLEKEIENLITLNDSILEIKSELIDLANKFHNNNIKYGNLGDSEKKDEVILTEFESEYKNMLFSFGYESNDKHQIWINRKEPFKYFPVYKNYSNDNVPQSIRINSSASDFVRNIWAYTLSLLVMGKNHPGVIMLDEPGQHRTNMSSLKSMFKSCCQIRDKQVIIFTSIDKTLNDKEKIDLDILIKDLPIGEFNLIRLNDFHKVIRKI